MTRRFAIVAATILGAATTMTAQQAPMVTALKAPWPERLIVEDVEILPVQKNIYLLAGAGAHVTAQIGDEGVTLVDSGERGKSAALLAAVRRLTRRPIRFLVNTGPDHDHVGGNLDIIKAAGGPSGPAGTGGNRDANENVGVMTIAHENAFNRMSAPWKDFPGLSGEALPVSTFFTHRKDFHANDEGVEILHQPAAHTDGDVLVFFRGSDVVSAGEILNTDSYPAIDLTRGGSVQGEIDALNTLLDITIPARNQMGGTRVVPAYGRICNEADVLEYRDMLTIIHNRVQALIQSGATLQQVKAAKPMLEYDATYGTNKGWTSEMFLEIVYGDLTKKK